MIKLHNPKKLEAFRERVPLNDFVFDGWDGIPAGDSYSVLAVRKQGAQNILSVNIRNIGEVNKFIADELKKGNEAREYRDKLTKKQAYDLKESLQERLFNGITDRERGQIFKK